MNLFRHFKAFLSANPAQGAQTTMPSSQNPAPPPPPKTGTQSTPTGTGHVERKRVSFQEVGPNDTIPESDEEWLRKGDVMEGIHHEVRIITGSGAITEASQLKSVCSQCHKAESVEIRSSLSNVPLCHTCLRRLTMPDGKVLILTPAEYEKELDRYDTWKALDNHQELPRR